MGKYAPFIIGLAFVFLMFGLGVIDIANYPKPRFNLGEMITTKISGQKGMIFDYICDHEGCRYWVRFAVPALLTDTHLIEPDGPIKSRAFSVVVMHEFELESAK